MDNLENYDNNVESVTNTPAICESVQQTQPTDNTIIAQASNHSEGSKKKKSGAGKIAAIAVCCSLAGGIIGSTAGIYFGNKLHLNNQSESSYVNGSTILEGMRDRSAINIANIDTSKIMTPSEVYAANVSSTVGIQTSITTNYWGRTTTSAASGSGFILTSDGYIITNFHVIENSDTITASLYDGTKLKAELIGYDESNDIAVIKVNADNLVPVVLGDSDNLNVGDTVVAIGNPLGELTFSLTQGAVSALDREITLSSNITMDLIQTDCAINSGNSGGALFNLYGEVIGITNAKYSGSGSSSEASIDNIGFAIPINNVRDIVKSIIENGYISKPYIGVTVGDVSEETQSYGLPAGASVRNIEDDSPAMQAGLELNDIITKIGDKSISSSQDLVDAIKESVPNDVLQIEIYRKNEYIQLELTVGEKIQSAMEQQKAQSNEPQEQNPLDGWNLPDWFYKFGF